jgi:broad specificity phosphatase PhoE
MDTSLTHILLIRHAASDAAGRLCGSFDVPLSSDGRAALAALVQRLRRQAPDALYTSTLRRAMDVADSLGTGWRLRPQPAEWAREIDCGDVEGMPFHQIRQVYPEHWARNESENDDDFAWPGGESYAAFRARILDGLRAAVASYIGGRVVVVTHAGVISQVLGVFRGRSPAAWVPDRPHPLTATEIAWQHGGPSRLLRFDDPDWATEGPPHA